MISSPQVPSSARSCFKQYKPGCTGATLNTNLFTPGASSTEPSGSNRQPLLTLLLPSVVLPLPPPALLLLLLLGLKAASSLVATSSSPSCHLTDWFLGES
jgi:hypothetical protein